MAGMIISPSDIDTSRGGDVDFNGQRFFTRVNRSRHLGFVNDCRAACHCSNRPVEWDCRAGRFLDGQEMCRCADRVPG